MNNEELIIRIKSRLKEQNDSLLEAFRSAFPDSDYCLNDPVIEVKIEGDIVYTSINGEHFQNHRKSWEDSLNHPIDKSIEKFILDIKK